MQTGHPEGLSSCLIGQEEPSLSVLSFGPLPDFKTSGNIVLYILSREGRRRGTRSLHSCATSVAKVKRSVVKGDSGPVERAQAWKSDNHRFKSKVGHLSAEGPLARPFISPGLCFVMSKLPASLGSYNTLTEMALTDGFSLPPLSSFASAKADACGEGSCTELCARPDQGHCALGRWKGIQSRRMEIQSSLTNA